ncbi:MAG: acyl-CoA dehydrogenase family protein [Candidatus Tectomicrobia bacterium]|uniref:Acyl-CoA dehydrogenase family protein n=1 Tax=Tectimicrobiota bacterium TaxID=2528274 RepID=A0A932CLR0_UNCTE|nr:acyl-CoA dehydrogenase family protein [Candidatus Tectomicrobia bacterium]
MERTIFSEEHRIFAETFQKFLQKELVPHIEEWERAEAIPREFWKKMGENGYLCPWADQAYGGAEADFLYSVLIGEGIGRVWSSGFSAPLHSDIVAPYIGTFGNEEQKQRWLPGCVSGDKITAVAMTEPGAGSDLKAIRATAIRDGDVYVLNGQKTFISNGYFADLVIVACKTNPKASPPYAGISLIVVERDTPGFSRGRKLEKIGLRAQDTAELIFEDCRVPVANRLGEEGKGFYYMMDKLQQERLVCSIGCQANAEAVLAMTIEYCQNRQAFDQPISKFQNTQFKLAEVATEIALGRTFLDRLVLDHMAGKKVVQEVSMAKWWISEMLKRAADQCLQLFGGYGYMMEYPIARAYVDARAPSIFAGTSEIMKLIIAKELGL